MVTLVTMLGPVFAVAGYFIGSVWLFWVGVGVCVVTLFLNLASGTMRFPVLPIAFMVAGAVYANSIWIGLAGGLVAWTTVEAVGELMARARRRAS